MSYVVISLMILFAMIAWISLVVSEASEETNQ
jgi:hypothetical protein